jgi:hypothetical protein
MREWTDIVEGWQKQEAEESEAQAKASARRKEMIELAVKQLEAARMIIEELKRGSLGELVSNERDEA